MQYRIWICSCEVLLLQVTEPITGLYCKSASKSPVSLVPPSIRTVGLLYKALKFSSGWARVYLCHSYKCIGWTSGVKLPAAQCSREHQHSKRTSTHLPPILDVAIRILELPNLIALFAWWFQYSQGIIRWKERLSLGHIIRREVTVCLYTNLRMYNYSHQLLEVGVSLPSTLDKGQSFISIGQRNDFTEVINSYSFWSRSISELQFTQLIWNTDWVAWI